MLLEKFDRVALAHVPTPLEPMPRLSAALGGARLWVKRDDCTGLAGGGNKTRKLEFLLADALAKGADTVLTAGAVQSNHARQTAAAAAKLGLRCELLLEDAIAAAAPEYRQSGNAFLDRLCGAGIHRCARDSDLEAAMAALAGELAAAGRRPYTIPVGGSSPLGALGYVRCAGELVAQCRATGARLDLVVHASGSAGTQAGLLAGFAALGEDVPVLGICVSRSAGEQEEKVLALARETFALLGLKAPPARESVRANGDYVGAGYGIPTRAMVEAVRTTARCEGLLLDPVYSGKAMAGLMDLLRREAIGRDRNVVFLHTGGSAGLFAYLSAFDGVESD